MLIYENAFLLTLYFPIPQNIMLENVITPKASHEISFSEDVKECVSKLIELAKVDRNGLYWPVVSDLQQANSRVLESSLGCGSAGVLLSVLEYYRATRDSAVLDVLEKGTAWILHRFKNDPFTHGLYTGTPGIWLFLKELDHVLPELSGDWVTIALEQLRESGKDVFISSVESGVAGTLLAAFYSLGLQNENLSDSVVSLSTSLLASAKPSTHGLYWDYTPTSVHASAGYVLGSAGVESCLALLSKITGSDYTLVLKSSLSHSNSLFDQGFQNWRELNCVSDMRSVTKPDIDQMLQFGKIDSFSQNIHVGESVSWGVGAVGILKSRLSLLGGSNESLSEIVKGDIELALNRLEKVSEEDISNFDNTVFNGLPGMFLSLDSCPQAVKERLSVSTLYKRALLDRTYSSSNNDLSLLNGVAGYLFAKIRAELGTNEPCFMDLSEGISQEGDSDGEKQLVGTASVLSRCMPQTIKVDGLCECLDREGINLNVIKAYCDTAEGLSSDTAKSSVVQYEIDLYEQLSEENFQKRFWDELKAQYLIFRNYSNGIDEKILQDRFVKNSSVSVVEALFDPDSAEVSLNSAPTPLLRHKTSRGIIDGKLTPLKHALLEEFNEGSIVIEVINTVVNKINSPGVTQRQLAEFCLTVIRGYIQSGYLIPEPKKSIWPFGRTKRLKKIQEIFFPEF